MNPWLVALDRLWRPVLEIAVLWLLYYRVLKFLHRTRAMQVLIALIFLLAAFFATQFLALTHIHWIMSHLFALSLVSLVVIFQPELRRALAWLVEGRGRWSHALIQERVLEEILKAVAALTRQRIGALIAIEREVELSPYVESGVALDSPVSAELLQTIFASRGPLHDGAVIVREGKVLAAGCLLPLSLHARLGKSLGTRHRAAIGLTEESDALVLVVSEETGAVSASIGGRLTRELDAPELRELLARIKTLQPSELSKFAPAAS